MFYRTVRCDLSSQGVLTEIDGARTRSYVNCPTCVGCAVLAAVSAAIAACVTHKHRIFWIRGVTTLSTGSACYLVSTILATRTMNMGDHTTVTVGPRGIWLTMNSANVKVAISINGEEAFTARRRNSDIQLDVPLRSTVQHLWVNGKEVGTQYGKCTKLIDLLAS